MTSPLPGNTSGTARLMIDAPSYAIGWQEPIYPPNPAAGAVWSHTVDGRYYERLITVRYNYLASAVVANRYPLLTLTDANGAIVLRVPTVASIVAGNNLAINLWPNNTSQAADNQGEQFNTLPDLLVPPGWTWTATVVNIDPGDQISNVVLQVQRFPNDTTAITAGE